MTSREQFEKWAKPNYRLYRNDTPGSDLSEYQCPVANAAWKAWQASRAQALEDAAKAIEKEFVQCISGLSKKSVIRRDTIMAATCADAIRQMKDKK